MCVFPMDVKNDNRTLCKNILILLLAMSGPLLRHFFFTRSLLFCTLFLFFAAKANGRSALQVSNDVYLLTLLSNWKKCQGSLLKDKTNLYICFSASEAYMLGELMLGELPPS